MSRLAGKRALVTGASRGIGRAVALRLAAEGASVALNYRAGREEAEAVSGEIASAGGSAVVLQGDVSVAAEAEALDAVVASGSRSGRAITDGGAPPRSRVALAEASPRNGNAPTDGEAHPRSGSGLADGGAGAAALSSAAGLGAR